MLGLRAVRIRKTDMVEKARRAGDRSVAGDRSAAVEPRRHTSGTGTRRASGHRRLRSGRAHGRECPTSADDRTAPSARRASV
jgi:hypothetical protein